MVEAHGTVGYDISSAIRRLWVIVYEHMHFSYSTLSTGRAVKYKQSKCQLIMAACSTGSLKRTKSEQIMTAYADYDLHLHQSCLTDDFQNGTKMCNSCD